MDINITLTSFRLNIMFLSYFLISCCSFPFLLSQISTRDSSFLRSKGTKRIIKSVQNFLLFNILDRILKLFFETIFKWFWTIKSIISNNHWMIYKLRVFWWDKEKEYPYQTLAPLVCQIFTIPIGVGLKWCTITCYKILKSFLLKKRSISKKNCDSENWSNNWVYAGG
jgi:hypothetical protein